MSDNQKRLLVSPEWVEWVGTRIMVLSAVVFIVVAVVPADLRVFSKIYVLNSTFYASLWVVALLCLSALLFVHYAGSRNRPYTFGGYGVWVVMILLLFLLYPLSGPAFGRGETWALGMVAFSVFTVVGLFVVSSARLARQDPGVRAIALLIVFLVFPICLVVGFINNHDLWTVRTESVGPDGESYGFLHSQTLPMKGSSIALGRLVSNTWFWKGFEDLGTTQFGMYGIQESGSSYHWRPVIRPAPAQEEDVVEIRWTDEDLMLGICLWHRCYLAYDIRNNKALAWKDLKHLSPFILLGATDELHEPDVDRMVRRLPPAGHSVNGRRIDYFSRPVLEEGLDHPNPKVRECAKVFLDSVDSEEEQDAQ